MSERVRVAEAPHAVKPAEGIEIPAPAPKPSPAKLSWAGERILLHICCAPCSTYTIQRLRELRFHVTGFWYNPNIHPWQEHERRRLSLEDYAAQVELPMIWHPNYEMPLFLRMVNGREQFRRRCAICYEMRLTQTARAAKAGGFPAFTTTLLISPYQDQELIRQLGERIAAAEGITFYFENFRRGWSERGRMATEYGLYRQQYCGCIYSEWERYNHAPIDTILPAESAG